MLQATSSTQRGQHQRLRSFLVRPRREARKKTRTLLVKVRPLTVFCDFQATGIANRCLKHFRSIVQKFKYHCSRKRLSHLESAYHDNDLLCGTPIPLARTTACEPFSTNRYGLYSRTGVT